jgi:hypothetical protein
MWHFHGSELAWKAASLSAGAIFVWFLIALAVRRRDVIAGIVALFAAVELLLTLSSLRHWSVSIPLLILAGTLFATWLPPRLRWAALAAMIAPAVIQFAAWHGSAAAPVIDEREQPWVRAASFLRRRPDRGRVLAPWSMGHALDVLGGHPVIIDNFGMMTDDEIVFDRAHDAFLAHDENALARYCDGAGIRYVVLDNPAFGLPAAADILGLERRQFMATKLAASTWWWRAYYRHQSRRFRLVYADPQPSWRGTPVLRGPALEIWERTP